MFKSIVYIALTSVLIFSILAPSIIELIADTDAIVLVDVGEEEKKEKLEKEIEEKIIQYFNKDENSTAFIVTNKTNFYYLEIKSKLLSEIVSPPPENII